MVRTTLSTLAFATLLVGCGGGPQPVATGIAPLGDETVTIVIVNNNFYDANIYAMYDGEMRRRLGTVGGHTRDTFDYYYSPRPLRMVMALIGPSGEQISDELLVSPGDVVELELLPNLHRRD